MDKVLLEVLVCPICKGRLKFHLEKNECVCRFDKLAFPIKQGIPVMIVDEARRMSSEELE